jgi:hypothetical protein
MEGSTSVKEIVEYKKIISLTKNTTNCNVNLDGAATEPAVACQWFG